MPGPSLEIRQKCPLATPANDGLMSSAFAAAVQNFITSGAAYIVWTSTMTWIDVYTLLQAFGGAGVVQIPASAVRTVTAGTYDLNSVQFVTYGRRSILNFATGVLIDGGVFAGLSISGSIVRVNGTMTAVGSAAFVTIMLLDGSFDNQSASPAFSLASTANSLFIRHCSCSKTGGGAVFDLTSAPALLSVNATLGGTTQSITSIEAGAITGVGGSTVNVITDALSNSDIINAVVGPTLGVVPTPYGTLSFPASTTGARPTADAGNLGQVIWNSTISQPQISSATAWPNLALQPTVGPVLDSTGANVTVAPTAAGINHVGGTGSIQNITVPYIGFTGPITFIPDAIWTLTLGANIGKTSTAVAGRPMVLTFDGTFWWPSY